MRRLLGVAVALMVVMPAVALAQSPDRPVVELGAQGSKGRWQISGLLGAAGQPAEATPPPRAAAQPAGTKPPPAAWRRVKPGREVWVWVTTGTRSLVHGDIVAISDSSLTIREQGREVTIRLDDVRLVEGLDSKKNGFFIGAVPGAVAGGWLGHSVRSALCSDSSGTCDDSSVPVVLLGAAGGALVGGLLGAMVDGLIPGRQTLFGGSTTVVTPVLTPDKKAIEVAVRWR